MLKRTLYNGVVFNLSWLACVLGGSVVAAPVVLLVVAVHLHFFSSNKAEIALIFVVVLLGIVVDGIFIRSGLLIPPDSSLWPPLWLTSLWALFATTLNHSMRWFQNHLYIAACVGGISGALSYLAGTRLSDFSLREPLPVTLGIFFFVWCIVFPTCALLGKQLRNSEESTPSKDTNIR